MTTLHELLDKGVENMYRKRYHELLDLTEYDQRYPGPDCEDEDLIHSIFLIKEFKRAVRRSLARKLLKAIPQASYDQEAVGKANEAPAIQPLFPQVSIPQPSFIQQRESVPPFVVSGPLFNTSQKIDPSKSELLKGDEYKSIFGVQKKQPQPSLFGLLADTQSTSIFSRKARAPPVVEASFPISRQNPLRPVQRQPSVQSQILFNVTSNNPFQEVPKQPLSPPGNLLDSSSITVKRPPTAYAPKVENPSTLSEPPFEPKVMSAPIGENPPPALENSFIEPLSELVIPEQDISIIRQEVSQLNQTSNSDLRSEVSSYQNSFQQELEESSTQETLVNQLGGQPTQKAQQVSEFLLNALSQDVIRQFENTCSTYHPSNYFHVGQRSSMLSFIRRVIEFVKKPVGPRPAARNNQDSDYVETGKAVIRLVEISEQDLQNTMSQYWSSNYFHVRPRRQMFGFVQDLISKVKALRNKMAVRNL